MNVVIIEDEAPAFRRLQKILEEVDPDINIIEVLDSVEESVSWLKSNDLPDLFFMDIQLSDGLSFEILEQVQVTKPIIFTTAFDEYLLKAFKVNSIDYLLKPIKVEDLQNSLSKYHELKNNFSQINSGVDLSEIVNQLKLEKKPAKSRFLIKLGDKLIAVETADIAYFYTHLGIVHLVTYTGKKYLMDYNLDELQNQLDPELFFRANRQYIVSFKAISVVHKYYKGKLIIDLAPEADEQVIVSAEKASNFKDWYGER